MNLGQPNRADGPRGHPGPFSIRGPVVTAHASALRAIDDVGVASLLCLLVVSAIGDREYTYCSNVTRLPVPCDQLLSTTPRRNLQRPRGPFLLACVHFFPMRLHRSDLIH